MSTPKNDPVVLLVDADEALQKIIAYHFKKSGYELQVAETGSEAMAKAESPVTCAVVNLLMGDGTDGMAVLRHLRQQRPEIPVIVLADRGDSANGLAAIQAGAFDYVTKPLEIGAFVATISAAVRTGASLRQSAGHSPGLRDTQWIGQSPSARTLRETASALGATQADVLVTGPEGSGKRLFARMLHHVSARARGPLVFVPCGSIPGDLLEAELFGRPTPSGAGRMEESPRQGRVQMAEGGTLVLLDIGEVPMTQQALILELLQNRWIQRRDSGSALPVSLRVIATSRGNLRAKVEAGEFREDLFYRLNALTVQIPSLRERFEDIPHLSGIFLQRLSMMRSGEIPRISPAAMATLEKYAWPGNVRELEWVLESACGNAVGGEIRLSDLPASLLRPSRSPLRLHGDSDQPYVGGMTMEAVEKLAVQQTLQLCQGNKAAAARILDVTEKTIYNKLVRLGLKEPAPVVPQGARRRGRRPMNRETPKVTSPEPSQAGGVDKPKG
ncbi:MAG: sigma-54-dependent transcriptional regulator [Verrucomicrobiota bacterium]